MMNLWFLQRQTFFKSLNEQSMIKTDKKIFKKYLMLIETSQEVEVIFRLFKIFISEMSIIIVCN